MQELQHQLVHLVLLIVIVLQRRPALQLVVHSTHPQQAQLNNLIVFLMHVPMEQLTLRIVTLVHQVIITIKQLLHVNNALLDQHVLVLLIHPLLVHQELIHLHQHHLVHHVQLDIPVLIQEP
jgi:hypothetical protein